MLIKLFVLGGKLPVLAGRLVHVFKSEHSLTKFQTIYGYDWFFYHWKSRHLQKLQKKKQSDTFFSFKYIFFQNFHTCEAKSSLYTLS